MSSWLGKIVGGGLGLIFGGPLGGILGASLGHWVLDRREEMAEKRLGNDELDSDSAQLLYFTLLFTLLAKVAGSDGSISRDEGQHLLRYLDQLDLTPEQRKLAIDIFNSARSRNESASACAAQFYRLQRHRPEVIRTLFEQLVKMATIDGWNVNKKRTLDEIASALRLNPLLLLFIYQQHGLLFDGASFRESSQQWSYRGQRGEFFSKSKPDPYSVLGLTSAASDQELRGAYRKLVRETHPDVLLSQGVPPEFRKNTEERFKEVQDAWDQIRKERKLS